MTCDQTARIMIILLLITFLNDWKLVKKWLNAINCDWITDKMCDGSERLGKTIESCFNSQHPVARSMSVALFLRYENFGSPVSFVNISTFCSPVLIASMLIEPSSTCDLKIWYSRGKCFVLGVKIVTFAILIQLLLSSNILHLIIGPELPRFNFDEIYLTRFIIGTTSLRHIDNAEY